MGWVREVPSCEAPGPPFLVCGTARSHGFYDIAKRFVDLVVAAMALVLLAPVLALVALAIKLTSPGPILFRGTVMGRDGRPFTYYKLRTMVAGSDNAAHRRFIEAYVGAEQAGRARRRRRLRRPPLHAQARVTGRGRVHKLVEDPRITAVGRLLRKTSLDEMPQMLNVIRGEMSIVGPRPPVPYEYQLYNDYHKQRLAVLPGITGLAQVRARSRASFEEMIEIDLEYIRGRSLGGDLAIMVRTVWVVLTGEGAH